jgi:hypothetical protein
MAQLGPSLFDYNCVCLTRIASDWMAACFGTQYRGQALLCDGRFLGQQGVEILGNRHRFPRRRPTRA